MKIYTKTGDGGETALFNGTRVPKDHLRVASYGDVDELSAALGVAAAKLPPGECRTHVEEIQRDLFAVGAHLADPGGATRKKEKAVLAPDRISRLETAIDGWEATLTPLSYFILPGGGERGAVLHLARTICRRAERAVVALSHAVEVDPIVIAYMNRLSDFLFVMARHQNRLDGAPEVRW